MVTRIFRLRIALLATPFRGSFARGTRNAFGLLFLLAIAVLSAAAPLLVDDARVRNLVDMFSGALVLSTIFFVPFFENRKLVDPRQFQTFPATNHQIAFTLLLSSTVTWSFIVFLTWLVSFVVFRGLFVVSPWVTLATVLLIAVFALSAVRVMSLLSRLIAGDRFTGFVRTVGVLLLLAILPAAVFATVDAFKPEGAKWALEASQPLSWTPFGAPFHVFALAQDPRASAWQLAHLGVLAAATIALAVIWFACVAYANRNIERPADPAVARRGLGWFERFRARPVSVIAARQLTYWNRDPRYRVALLAIPLAPAAMLAAFWVAGAQPHHLALVPLPVILLLLGWSQHNDLAMDSTAIWVHVASGVHGLADRVGRLAPVMFLGVPIALIGSSITVTLLGDWRVLPAVLGMNLGVLLVSSGVASVFSVLTPYPTTRPGDSPFLQPQWAGSGAGLAQTVSMISTLVLCAPPVWVSVNAISNVEFISNVWAFSLGASYGLIILGVGVFFGSKIFARNGPELIQVTQVFD